MALLTIGTPRALASHRIDLFVEVGEGSGIAAVEATVRAMGQDYTAALAPADGRFAGSIELPETPRYVNVRLLCTAGDLAVHCGDIVRFTDDLEHSALAWRIETVGQRLWPVQIDAHPGVSLELQVAWGLLVMGLMGGLAMWRFGRPGDGASGAP